MPLRLAAALADAGRDVGFSTTTRSPAVVVDEPDYALAQRGRLPAHDDPADGPGPRFAYNVAARALGPRDRGGRPARRHARRLRRGLLPALAPHTRRTTVVVTP